MNHHNKKSNSLNLYNFLAATYNLFQNPFNGLVQIIAPLLKALHLSPFFIETE